VVAVAVEESPIKSGRRAVLVAAQAGIRLVLLVVLGQAVKDLTVKALQQVAVLVVVAVRVRLAELTIMVKVATVQTIQLRGHQSLMPVVGEVLELAVLAVAAQAVIYFLLLLLVRVQTV
jgi:hypothetical protein